MSSSSVWVQLYYKYEGKVEPEGRPVEIEPIPKNINALVKATKKELSPGIDHASPALVFVYKPDTTHPFSEDRAIDAGDPVPTDSTSKNPLIVVAPAPPQKPANGKKTSRFGLSVCC